MGRAEDIQLALRRREQREAKNKKCNVANLTEVQWMRGKASPRGNRGTLWKKAPYDFDHPPSAIPKREQCGDVLRTMRDCGNRWQRIPLTMMARDSKMTTNNRTVLSSTGKRQVKIERPFCPRGHGSMMMQATPQRSLSDGAQRVPQPRLGNSAFNRYVPLFRLNLPLRSFWSLPPLSPTKSQ